MYKNILVPTDLTDSEHTIKLLKKADSLLDNGTLTLLHVVEVLPAFVLTELSNDVVEKQVPAARNAMEKMVEKSGVKAEIKVVKGPADKNIIGEAKDMKADLILVNSRENAGLKEYLLGSTAARVVRRAHCSVLVIRFSLTEILEK